MYRFARCTTCVSLRERMNATHDPVTKKALGKELIKDLELIKSERLAYQTRRNAAMRNPKERLSIILDGTSQAAYSVPRFAEVTKDTSTALKMKTHVVGAKVHGVAAFIYLVTEEWHHDSNLSIELSSAPYVAQHRVGRPRTSITPRSTTGQLRAREQESVLCRISLVGGLDICMIIRNQYVWFFMRAQIRPRLLVYARPERRISINIRLFSPRGPHSRGYRRAIWSPKQTPQREKRSYSSRIG